MLRVQTGDAAAFDALFVRYQNPLWSFLIRRTRDEQSSSELFQEVFLKVWRAAGTFRPEYKVRPWLYRIAVNAMRDRYRASQRELEVDDSASVEDVGTAPLRTLDRMALESAIAQLPPAYQEAFLLGVVHGLDHNELADALNISPANARARVSRARSRLRALLSEAEP